MKVKRYLRLVLLLIIISLSVFLGINQKNELKNARNITKLPQYSFIDHTGLALDFINFENFLFVQFISSQDDYNFSLIENVYKDYFSKGLNIVIIPKDSDIYEKLYNKFPDTHIINNNYYKLEEIFRAKSCCGKHYLFDNSHNLLYSESNNTDYEEGIKSILLDFIDGKKFHISHFINNSNIFNLPWFSTLWNSIIGDENQIYLLSMFSRVCSTCISGKILSELKRLKKIYNSSITFIVILSNDFSDNDILNFKTNLKIDFQVIKAPQEFALKWNTLMEEYGKNRLTNILLLIDKNGNIIKTSDNSSITGMNDFFSYIKNMF